MRMSVCCRRKGIRERRLRRVSGLERVLHAATSTVGVERRASKEAEHGPRSYPRRVGEQSLESMFASARTVWRRFADQERREWSFETMVIELAKQVGDLARVVLSRERYYLSDRDQLPGYDGSLAAVGNELADILYCVIGIADHYGIDLPAAHERARAEDLRHLQALRANEEQTSGGG